MKMFCFDCNILVSLLASDEELEGQDRLLRWLFSDEILLWAPANLNFEFANVLARKRDLGLLSPKDESEALTFFFRLPVMMLWDQVMIQEARSLQSQAKLSFFDACYLATAKIKQAALVTNDQSFLKSAKGVYPQVYGGSHLPW